ncbi:response regulator [bacterium]|nr:response regulator [bacterium]
MRLKPIVLSIDDDPVFRKIVNAVLTRLNITSHCVGTADEFYKKAETLKPDLYLIDINVEETNDGFAIIETLRKTLDPATPIIIVTGGGDPTLITQALEFGASDFIFKPLDRNLLISKLSQFINSQGLEDSKGTTVEFPAGVYQAKLELGCRISEIDEYGIRLVSKHLIPKETVIRLKSDILHQIHAETKDLLTNVTATWFDAENQYYGAYAEFTDDNTQFLEALRHWLVRKN